MISTYFPIKIIKFAGPLAQSVSDNQHYFPSTHNPHPSTSTLIPFNPLPSSLIPLPSSLYPQPSIPNPLPSYSIKFYTLTLYLNLRTTIDIDILLLCIIV